MVQVIPFIILVALACADPSPPLAALANPLTQSSEVERGWQQLPDADSLREEYAAHEDFAARCELDRPLQEAFELLHAESWSDLVAVSGAFLSRCPVDIDFHQLRAIALSELGREVEAAQHHQWTRVLVESVLRSGAGDSIGSPWIVISVSEEYAVLRALGMQHQGQALLDGGIDAITVTVDGESRSVYFFPEAHWVRLEREFAE